MTQDRLSRDIREWDTREWYMQMCRILRGSLMVVLPSLQGGTQHCMTSDVHCFFTKTTCGQGYNFTVYSVSGECSSESSPPAFVKTGAQASSHYISEHRWLVTVMVLSGHIKWICVHQGPVLLLGSHIPSLSIWWLASLSLTTVSTYKLCHDGDYQFVNPGFQWGLSISLLRLKGTSRLELTIITLCIPWNECVSKMYYDGTNSYIAG